MRNYDKCEAENAEEAEKKGALVPPSKLVVGVIATTSQKRKYQVYQVNENNKPVSVREMMDMEGCVKLILGTV
ncbi:hypothetical protein G9A89_003570 [Geosiphon pyriformis]|nr:hypothetical protein G9A89_003570 [Geosiphon pyriformis]